jgi:hypothetical protein
MLELLRQMERVRREEERRNTLKAALKQREKQLKDVEGRSYSCTPGTKKHAHLDERVAKVERKVDEQESKVKSAKEAIAAAKEELAAIQAKQSLTSLGERVSIPKAKVRTWHPKLSSSGRVVELDRSAS